MSRPRDLQERFERALRMLQAEQWTPAESLLISLNQDLPVDAEVLRQLAALAVSRKDMARAGELYREAWRAAPDDGESAMNAALAFASLGRHAEARELLEAQVLSRPSDHAAWLLLGRLREATSDGSGALTAFLTALTHANAAGDWTSSGKTPAQWHRLVEHAREAVRQGRRELYLAVLDELRARYGRDELRRVELALSGYLKDCELAPSDPRQNPRFLYFPGLPDRPFLDPELQPWARNLQSAFRDIQSEARRVVAEDARLPPFISKPPGGRMEDYVAGAGPSPSWEAFFFYRRGQRFDANHSRCPVTSSVLESIDLCRIAGDAPEILYSVLRPGSHILPHHGVTNIRSVMHLPLQVPPDCGLRIVGHGDHQWREGELVMFDDTFLHEAWNHSATTRIVLLMDCWNPFLSAVERVALKRLVEVIGSAHAVGSGGASVP